MLCSIGQPICAVMQLPHIKTGLHNPRSYFFIILQASVGVTATEGQRDKLFKRYVSKMKCPSQPGLR